MAANKPDLYIEIARDQGWSTTGNGYRSDYGWTDISQYVENPEGMEITRGRRDELSSAEPAHLTLTLNNKDGRFTPGYASGAYYPHIRKGLPIRVTARWPLITGAATDGNWHPNPSVETSLTGPDGNAWHSNTALGGLDEGTVTRSNTRAHDGSWSALLTGVYSTKGCWVGYRVPDLVIGRTYTVSLWVYVPSGDVDVRIDVLFHSQGSYTSTKAAWVKLSHTFTATSSFHFIGVAQKPTVAAGDQVWVDEVLVQEGSTVGTYNTNDPAIRERFMGFVDDWPVTWPAGQSFFSNVAISATGVLGRIGQSASLASVAQEEIMYDGPKGYYPLTEEAGGTSCGDISGNAMPPLSAQQTGNGGRLNIGGTEAGPTGSNTQPAVNFDRSDASNGKFLGPSGVEMPLRGWATNFTAIEACFRTDTRANMCIASVHITGGLECLDLMIDGSTGKAKGEVILFDGSYTYNSGSALSASAVDDNQWHHAVLWLEEASSTTMRAKFSVDGATPTTIGTFTRNVGAGDSHPDHPAWNRLRVGQADRTTSYLLEGDVAHVAVYSCYYNAPLPQNAQARFLDHYKATVTGFTPESVSDRLTRYAKWTGLPTSRVVVYGTASDVGHVDTNSKAPLEAMQSVERTDGGCLYDTGGGNLGYESRTQRYTATSSFSLSATDENLEDDLEFRLDDQFLCNEVIATTADGGQIRVFDTDSKSRYGPYVSDVEMAGVDDNHILAAAQWRVERYKEPDIRCPRAAVNLYGQDSSLVSSLLAADVGTRLTLTSLPSQAPASSSQWYIEGLTETITSDGWIIRFDLSPVSLGAVWLLGDASFGQLGSTTILAF